MHCLELSWPTRKRLSFEQTRFTPDLSNAENFTESILLLATTKNLTVDTTLQTWMVPIGTLLLKCSQSSQVNTQHSHIPWILMALQTLPNNLCAFPSLQSFVGFATRESFHQTIIRESRKYSLQLKFKSFLSFINDQVKNLHFYRVTTKSKEGLFRSKLYERLYDAENKLAAA